MIALSDYKDLSPAQRVAHLVFQYDSEVLNGGHLQYFENVGTSRVEETLSSLEVMGAHHQRDILAETVAIYRKVNPEESKVQSVEEFVELALEGTYSEFDNRYYACNPRIQELLEAYLQAHFDEFIELL